MKHQENFELLCISKGKLRAFAREARRKFLMVFKGKLRSFGTGFARSAKKFLRIFKGKLMFLVAFRAKREENFRDFQG